MSPERALSLKRDTLIFSVIAFFVALFFYKGVAIDDSYIVYRFSNNAFNGNGFQWNIGESPVEGMTSILWTIILIPFSYNVDHIYFWAKVISLVCILVSLLYVKKTTDIAFGDTAISYAFWVSTAIPLLVFHAMNGLETGITIMMIVVMVYHSVKCLIQSDKNQDVSSSSRNFALSWLLGGMARPELVIFGFVQALLIFLFLSPDTKRKFLTKVGLYFVIPGLAYFVIRWQYFGQFMPQTFYAKRASGLISPKGLGYVVLSQVGLLGGCLLLSSMGLLLNEKRTLERKIFHLLIWPSVLVSTSYVFFQPQMGFVFRFTTPYLAPLAISTIATMYIVGSSGRPAILKLPMYFLATLTAFQLLTPNIPAYHWATVISLETNEFHKQFGQRLSEIEPKGSLLALNDVGGPALFSGWKAYEGAGLVTSEVTSDNYGPEELINKFNPDIIIETGCNVDDKFPEHEALGYELIRPIPWLVYTVRGPRYHQCILSRSDYSQKSHLREISFDLGSAEIQPPWYMNMYQWLKRSAYQ